MVKNNFLKWPVQVCTQWITAVTWNAALGKSLWTSLRDGNYFHQVNFHREPDTKDCVWQPISGKEPNIYSPPPHSVLIKHNKLLEMSWQLRADDDIPLCMWHAADTYSTKTDANQKWRLRGMILWNLRVTLRGKKGGRATSPLLLAKRSAPSLAAARRPWGVKRCYY